MTIFTGIHTHERLFCAFEGLTKPAVHAYTAVSFVDETLANTLRFFGAFFKTIETLASMDDGYLLGTELHRSRARFILLNSFPETKQGNQFDKMALN